MDFRIEVIKTEKYWRLKGRNGEILAHSEKYKSLQSARKTAFKVYDSLMLCDYKEV